MVEPWSTLARFHCTSTNSLFIYYMSARRIIVTLHTDWEPAHWVAKEARFERLGPQGNKPSPPIGALSLKILFLSTQWAGSQWACKVTMMTLWAGIDKVEPSLYSGIVLMLIMVPPWIGAIIGTRSRAACSTSTKNILGQAKTERPKNSQNNRKQPNNSQTTVMFIPRRLWRFCRSNH